MKPINLYSESYYDTLNGTFQNVAAIPQPIKGYGSASTFIRGCFVLLLRAGFVLIQLGSIPIENVYIILLQNIVDIAVSIASFGLVGYILAFGYDALNGAVGYGMWIISKEADLDNAILGLSACIIATAIVTTILSGRVHFVGYLLTYLLFAMFFQPIVMHWVWHDYGWMHRRQFLGHLVSVKDHAGGIVVHVTGGVVGLIGSLFLGSRLIRLSDIDESSIGAESPGSTITGYIFIALGLIAFSLPAPSYEASHIPDNYIGIILVNNIMAMAAGIIVVVILQFLFFREPFNYWIILRCMQGAITGIVSIAAGIDVYSPLIAYAIASFAALIFYFVVMCMQTTSIEDYCNAIPIHLVGGLIGTLLPPILGTAENLGMSTTSHLRVIHLGWQLVSVSTVSGLMLVVFTIHFFVMQVTGFFRNKSEEVNHRRGVTAAVRGPERCFLQRLFTWSPSTPLIEPGTIGKSPEQIHAYQNVEFVGGVPGAAQTKQQRKVAQVIEKVKEDDTAKKPRFIYTVHNIDDQTKRTPDTLESRGDAGRSDANPNQGVIKTNEDILKSHSDGISDPSPNQGINKTKQYVLASSGDASRSDPNPKQSAIQIASVVKLEELMNSATRLFSYYELHRTRKFTNLFRQKRVPRKWGFRAVRQITLSQSPECASYDSKYNDGFVTIKMPGTECEADLSDASDSL